MAIGVISSAYVNLTEAEIVRRSLIWLGHGFAGARNDVLNIVTARIARNDVRDTKYKILDTRYKV